ATTQPYTLSLHDALPIYPHAAVAEDIEDADPAGDHGEQHAGEPGHEDVDRDGDVSDPGPDRGDQHVTGIINEKRPPRLSPGRARSEEHTSELQSPDHIVC